MTPNWLATLAAGVWPGGKLLRCRIEESFGFWKVQKWSKAIEMPGGYVEESSRLWQRHNFILQPHLNTLLASHTWRLLILIKLSWQQTHVSVIFGSTINLLFGRLAQFHTSILLLHCCCRDHTTIWSIWKSKTWNYSMNQLFHCTGMLLCSSEP